MKKFFAGKPWLFLLVVPVGLWLLVATVRAWNAARKNPEFGSFKDYFATLIKNPFTGL